MQIRTLTTDYMESHCYLLIEDGHTVVIDPGDASLVRRAVSEESVAVDLAILTHEHCDHVFGCSELRDAFQCRILSSRTCNENLMDSKKNLSRYFNALVDLQSKYRKESQKGINPFTTHADELFDGERSIFWMGHTLHLRETPGHSPGSICIRLDENFLFSGDSLMRDDDTGTQFIGGSSISGVSSHCTLNCSMLHSSSSTNIVFIEILLLQLRDGYGHGRPFPRRALYQHGAVYEQLQALDGVVHSQAVAAPAVVRLRGVEAHSVVFYPYAVAVLRLARGYAQSARLHLRRDAVLHRVFHKRLYRAGAWYDDTSDFCELDEIFFASSKYVSDDNPYGVYHTGMIVDWGYIEELGTDGFTVIEGNTTYEGVKGRVAYKYYAYDDPRILGAGRPNWDGWSPDGDSSSDNNDTTPEPEPNPEPTPEPYTVWFKVHTNGGVLRLRSAPNTSSAYLIGIPNGTELESNAIVEGEEIEGDTRWAHTTYKGYTGFVSCAWLD